MVRAVCTLSSVKTQQVYALCVRTRCVFVIVAAAVWPWHSVSTIILQFYFSMCLSNQTFSLSLHFVNASNAIICGNVLLASFILMIFRSFIRSFASMLNVVTVVSFCLSFLFGFHIAFAHTSQYTLYSDWDWPNGDWQILYGMLVPLFDINI